MADKPKDQNTSHSKMHQVPESDLDQTKTHIFLDTMDFEEKASRLHKGFFPSVISQIKSFDLKRWLFIAAVLVSLFLTTNHYLEGFVFLLFVSGIWIAYRRYQKTFSFEWICLNILVLAFLMEFLQGLLYDPYSLEFSFLANLINHDPNLYLALLVLSLGLYQSLIFKSCRVYTVWSILFIVALLEALLIHFYFHYFEWVYVLKRPVMMAYWVIGLLAGFIIYKIVRGDRKDALSFWGSLFIIFILSANYFLYAPIEQQYHFVINKTKEKRFMTHAQIRVGDAIFEVKTPGFLQQQYSDVIPFYSSEIYGVPRLKVDDSISFILKVKTPIQGLKPLTSNLEYFLGDKLVKPIEIEKEEKYTQEDLTTTLKLTFLSKDFNDLFTPLNEVPIYDTDWLTLKVHSILNNQTLYWKLNESEPVAFDVNQNQFSLDIPLTTLLAGEHILKLLDSKKKLLWQYVFTVKEKLSFSILYPFEGQVVNRQGFYVFIKGSGRWLSKIKGFSLTDGLKVWETDVQYENNLYSLKIDDIESEKNIYELKLKPIFKAPKDKVLEVLFEKNLIVSLGDVTSQGFIEPSLGQRMFDKQKVLFEWPKSVKKINFHLDGKKIKETDHQNLEFTLKNRDLTPGKHLLTVEIVNDDNRWGAWRWTDQQSGYLKLGEETHNIDNKNYHGRIGLILDLSQSMMAYVDGKRKIDWVRELFSSPSVFKQLKTSLAQGALLKGDNYGECSDSKILSPSGFFKGIKETSSSLKGGSNVYQTIERFSHLKLDKIVVVVDEGECHKKRADVNFSHEIPLDVIMLGGFSKENEGELINLSSQSGGQVFQVDTVDTFVKSFVGSLRKHVTFYKDDKVMGSYPLDGREVILVEGVYEAKVDGLSKPIRVRIKGNKKQVLRVKKSSIEVKLLQ